MRNPERRRAARLAAGLVSIVLAAAVARPVVHVVRTALRERGFSKLTPVWGPTDVEDISRLNRTRVRAMTTLPQDEAGAIEMLRRLLRDAKEQHLSVSIAGARHSMGGHTFTPDGVVVDMLPLRAMSLDDQQNLLHVQAGAKWEDVIPFLGVRGLSVSIMQSDSPFTVGGSLRPLAQITLSTGPGRLRGNIVVQAEKVVSIGGLSVNCHGWQNDRPPLASTVESFRLLLADGRIIRCSRTENSEIFSAALGGYGLLGIILDADLRVVPDARYRIERKLVPSAEYVAELD